MTKERLKGFKSITTWSGVAVTVCGIILNLASGGSWWSNGLSLFGVLLTCCGHWIGSALAKHQAAEREADENRFEELEFSLRKSEEEREHIFHAYEAQSKRTATLESESLSTKRQIEEVRRGLYNAP